MGEKENVPQREILEFINNKRYLRNVVLKDIITDGCLYRVNSKGMRGRKSTLPPGFPDIIGDIRFRGTHTRPVYIEVKAPGVKCTNSEQLEFIKLAHERGCVACIVDSVRAFVAVLTDYV